VTFGLVDQFHTGFVVRDLDAVIEGLREVLDLRWTAVQHVTIDAWTDQGREQIPMRYVYSVETPHIELIEANASSIWRADGALQLHHLGFWVDDLPAEAVRLEALGLVPELAGASDDDAGPHRFTYHRHETGLRIELVDRVMVPFMEQLWRNA
jgi:hypothetical protein